MALVMKDRQVAGVLLALDILAVCLGNLGAVILWRDRSSSLPVSSAINLLIIAVLTILCLSGAFGSPRSGRRPSAFIGLPLLRSGFAIIVACSFLAFIDTVTGTTTPLLAVPLPFVLTWLVVAGAATVGNRSLCSHFLVARKSPGKTRIAIVGAGGLGAKLAAAIEERFIDQFNIIGIYDDRSTRVPTAVNGIAVEPVVNLQRQVRKNHVDTVLVALPLSAEERLFDVLLRLKSLPVDVSLVPDELGIRLIGRDSATSRESIDQLFLNIFHRPMTAGDLMVKRTFDVVVSVILLIFLAPIMIFTALAIVLNSSGPVFFRQPRAGLCDEVIRVFKFRTMYADRTDLLAQQQTQRDDPRITLVGKFLRKTSIDELPQLFNVLMGEMSLVGPRPHATGMQINGQLCHEILREYAHRHRVKPGVTGWAQVSGFRGAVEDTAVLTERIKHDIYYIDNWSLWFDIEILLKTIPEVLFSKNAY
jgi:Undecaprenyl-phosphate glucose phosphotransferase